MSIIRNKELSLPEVIAESNLIVEVEYKGVFEEEVKISDYDGKPVPSFLRKGCVFQVKNILKNTSGAEPSLNINVPDENWRRSLSQYKERYGGKSKSFTVNEYLTSVPSIKKAGVLFLHRFQDTYELVVRDAFESTDIVTEYISNVGKI